MNAWLCCVRLNFFSIASRETDSGKRLRNDLFRVEWDAKPRLNQSVSRPARLGDAGGGAEGVVFGAVDRATVGVVPCDDGADCLDAVVADTACQLAGVRLRHCRLFH